MDFDKLLRDSEKRAPVVPRELYESLPEKAEGYGYLRDVQGQVLSKWHDRRDERDLVLKVNTGAGKTIDGLVILQSHLNAGTRPALYVAPSIYLVDQVRKEAARIGLTTVDDPDSPKYLSGEVIGVVTVSKLFNGKSVFRDTRSPRSPVPVGAVVIDDAHAALNSARDGLSLSIPHSNPAFVELLDLFRDDLRTQFPNALLDIDDKAYGALARVPFWAWHSKIDAVRKILQSHRQTQDLDFAWPAVREVLEFCRVVFTAREVTIVPLCNPISLISNFARAKHRIYLTATLADDSVLVTDFGADPASIANPITPVSAGDIGERMILAPTELDPSIEEESVRRAIKKLSLQHNVVVIVPSNRASLQWSDYADEVVSKDNVSDIVAQLRAGHVGLVVFVNRYDGIDLPGTACRVLVLDGLPEAFSGDERIESQLTTRTSGIDEHQVQRIEQGMGRGVRSNEDHCVVFLVGARLTQLIANPSSFDLFGPATRAQLEQSRQIAKGLHDAGLQPIIDVAEQALNRDANWVRYAKSGLAAIPPVVGAVRPSAPHRRRGFDLAVNGSTDAAAQALSDAAGAATDDDERGWLLEQKAHYLDLTDPAGAQQVLAAARAKNPSVFRPLSGVTYKRLSASAAQATACSDFLVQRYGTDGVALRVGFQSILDDLVFDPEATPRFEEAMRLLGLHLGFAAERPEHELGHGPDVLWAMGGLRFWVIEAKSGVTTNYISKHDINQLSGSINWFHQQYDDTVEITPVMIHPSTVLGRDASESTGARVITEDTLNGLRNSVRAFSAALASQRWDVPDAVDGLLRGHSLRAGDLARYLKAMRRSTR